MLNNQLINTLKLLHERMAERIEDYNSAIQENADESIIKNIRTHIELLRENIEQLECQLFEEFGKE